MLKQQKDEPVVFTLAYKYVLRRQYFRAPEAA